MSRTVPPYVRIHIHTYIHAYIHTHAHTHTKVHYIYVYINSWKFIYSRVSLANEILRAVLSSERIFFLGRETDF